MNAGIIGVGSYVPEKVVTNLIGEDHGYIG